MENMNLLDLDNDILNIIGDYVKKDNLDRMHKICKKYTKLYEKLDRKKESERKSNFNDEEREEYTIQVKNLFNRFEKLEELIENKYNDIINSIIFDCCRTKPCAIFEILIDGEYKRFRYF